MAHLHLYIQQFFRNMYMMSTGAKPVQEYCGCLLDHVPYE